MEQIVEILSKYSLVRMLVAFVLLITILMGNAIVMGYLERKIAAKIQRRWGPMEVGIQGWLQMFLDGVKLLSKQLIVPREANRFLFRLAPLLCFTPAMMAFAVIPFSEELYAIDLNIGLIYILAMGSLNVFSILIAGWSSNNKYSMYGAMRSVAQNIAYEIPILLSLLSVVLVTTSFNLKEIVGYQSGFLSFWMIQPVALVIFLIAGCAETNRAPFDMPEAESELTAGYFTEYGGFSFGVFAIAEYGNLFIMSSVTTIMFLGGWNGPFGFDFYSGPLMGAFWFLLKVFILMLIMIWVRWTYPRVRFDQLMNLSWKYLIPFSLVNLLITAFIVKII